MRTALARDRLCPEAHVAGTRPFRKRAPALHVNMHVNWRVLDGLLHTLLFYVGQLVYDRETLPYLTNLKIS